VILVVLGSGHGRHFLCFTFVMPAEAGFQAVIEPCSTAAWIPAFAGMTDALL
jgi:hypothetical protein